MKIIELLTLIAKGEEPPQKIKFENYIYVWRDYQKDYFCKQINHSLESIIGEYLFNSLNDEVEIIEEEKEIEKIDFRTLNTQKEKNRVMKDTINQLIDVINDMRDKE